MCLPLFYCQIQYYDFNEEGTMSCNGGFSGKIVTTRCTGLNTWSEKTPTCTSKNCRSKQLKKYSILTRTTMNNCEIQNSKDTTLLYVLLYYISFIKINIYVPAFNGVLMMNMYYTHLFQCTGHAIL